MEGLGAGQCERVFGAVVNGVKEGGGQQGASVNLVRGPVGVEGMWRGDGEGEREGEEEGGFTGMFFVSFFSWGFGTRGEVVGVGLKERGGGEDCCVGLIDRSC